MPFKKGESGNPETTFKEGQSGNPDGRPPGSLSFKVIAEKILDGKITIEQAGEIRQITRKEKAILNIIDDAVNDEDPNIRLKALAYIIERTEGKVPDKIEYSGTGMFSVSPASAEQIDALLTAINGASE